MSKRIPANLNDQLPEYGDLAEALAAARRHVQALSTVAQSLAQASTSSGLFDALASVVERQLGASGISVYSVDPGSGRVGVAYVGGRDVAEVAPLVHRAVTTDSIQRLFHERIEGFHSDIPAEEADPLVVWAGIPPPPGVRAVARLPLRVGNELRGALTIRWDTPRTFDDAERELLRDLAIQAACALRDAEHLAREREHHRFAEAAAAIEERVRLLAIALDTMDQAVILISSDRRITYANPAALRLFGYSADEMEGAILEELVSTPVPTRRTTPLSGPELPAVWLTEHMQRRRDGSTFPASIHLSLIRDSSNAPAGQVVLIRDLTEERRMAEHLRQSEKLAALGELVAGVAHELNNPIAGISAFAQLLLEDPLEPEQLDSVRLIRREADRAVAVIRDLLLFSRKSGPARSSVDLNEVVAHTLRLRSYGLRTAGIDVRVDLAPSLPLIPGDAQRLQQVVLNLIVNAEHAMTGTGTRRLDVRTGSEGHQVILVVADTGTGINEETRQRIFEPFFTTKPVGQGTGLGLSVSYGIVRAHGGTIDVESSPGAGATFRVSLPVEPVANAIVA